MILLSLLVCHLIDVIILNKNGSEHLLLILSIEHSIKMLICDFDDELFLDSRVIRHQRVVRILRHVFKALY